MWLSLAAFGLARALSLGAILWVGWSRHLRLGEVLSAWDGTYYREIASSGYHAGSWAVAFFPLYPLLVKPLLLLGAGFATGGLVVVLLCGAVAAVAVALLVRDFTDDRTAILTSTLWSAQPAAYVLSVTYSEALFTALAAGCLLALVRRRYLLAGLCAAASSATRPSWAAVALACAAVAIIVRPWERKWARWLPVLMAPLGSIAFFGYLWRTTGISPRGWLAVERAGWNTHLDGGSDNLYWIRHLLDTAGFYHALGHPWWPMWWVPVLLLFAIVGVVLLAADRAPLPVTVYAASVVVLACVTAGVFTSIPRLLLPAFPVLVPFARRHPWPMVGVWVAFLGLMVALGVMEFDYLKPGDPAP